MAALVAPDHIYSKVTSASISATLSQSSISIGINDPSSKKDAKEIAVQLYNGEAVRTATHGMQIPRAGLVITSNFLLDSSARRVCQSFHLAMYVYMYVCMYVCMCVCMYVRHTIPTSS